MSEEHEFKAEISELMHLIVNSFYSNRDIFLRELVSNSSDAIDKIRFDRLKEESDDKNTEYKISIQFDDTQMIIHDNGVGMTKEDMMNNLGTIAHSGTKAFMQNIKDGGDASNMIGQFGVGFYSAFLVADEVTVYSKKQDDKLFIWKSAASGVYSIVEGTDDIVGDRVNGTSIVLKLKEDAVEEYSKEHKIREIIRTHSQFISYPIEIEVERTETEEVPIDDEEEDKPVEDKSVEDKPVEDKPEVIVEDVTEEEEKKPKTKKIEKKVKKWELLNKDKPVWLKTGDDTDDITDQEYMGAYRAISGELHKYQKLKHITGEGQINYKGLLFIPHRPPRDLFDSKKSNSNIKLYVNNVFITDKCTDIVPEWLEFVFGVVDSPDIPLNVSRELLQGNKTIKIIGKQIVKKSIEMMEDIMKSEDEKVVKEFYDNFAKCIKFGVNSDTANREKLLKLVRYDTALDKKAASLADYIKDMKEDQTGIYFITGPDRTQIDSYPILSYLKSNGYDVLIMTDPMDEYVMQNISEYQGKKFVNISKDGMELPESIKNVNSENDTEEYKALIDKVKDVLKEKVGKVVINRIMDEDSPCCIKASKQGYSGHMERILKSQALKNGGMMGGMKNEKIFEINPNNYLIKNIQENIDADQVPSAITSIYNLACITSGFELDDPSDFSKKIIEFIKI